MIIGISGKMGAGKNCLGELLVKHFEQAGYKFRLIAFADALKDAYCNAHGLTREQLEREKDMHRAGLQAFGEKMREQDPAYWIKRLDGKMFKEQNYIITDVRYRNEVQWIRDKGGLNFRVIASPAVRATRRELTGETHKSEIDLDMVKAGIWHTIFDNNYDVPFLEDQVRQLMTTFLPRIKEFIL